MVLITEIPDSKTMATKDFHPVSIPATSRSANLVWSERSLSLADLLKESLLPLIVKMNADDKSKQTKKQKDASAMLQQPLLLYKEVKGYKVVARNISSLVAVKTSKDGVEYKEGGSVIVLPVDYQGWFRILEEDTVPILNVATIARVMPTSFLSTKRITGFTLLDPLNKKDIMYEKLDFPPGVFIIHSLYEDYVKYTTAEKGPTKRKLLRCLVCVTTDGIDVLIPFDAAGEFYIVQRKKPQAASRVVQKSVKSDGNACAYTLKQLLAMGVFTKPLVLKLLLGEQPNKPCGFTGVMKVFDIVKDWTVIAETLDGKRKLLELPVLPFPEFITATNGKDLLDTGSLHSELVFMSSGVADQYSKEIKVKTSFHLEAPEAPSKTEEMVTKTPIPPISDSKSLPVPPISDKSQKPEIPPLILKGHSRENNTKL